MAENTSTTRETIVERIATIASLPGASVETLSMSRDPNVPMEELVEAIELDAGLTANLLRWANSAYFGGSQQIVSIRDGIVRLGMNRMSQLVVTSMASPVMGRPVEGYGLPKGGLFHYSIAVGFGTTQVAEQLGIEAPSGAFTAGLLHDIGKLVMGKFVGESGEAIRALASRGVPFDEAEREVLGIDHAEVGAILLKRWNIPREIVEVVRWHHQPDKFEGDTSTLDVVRASERIVSMSKLSGGDYDESDAPPLAPGFESIDAEQVLTKIHEALESANAVLSGTEDGQ